MKYLWRGYDKCVTNQSTQYCQSNIYTQYSPPNIAYMSAPRRHLEPARGAGAGLGGRHGLGRQGQEQAGRGLQRHHQEARRQVSHQEMLIMWWYCLNYSFCNVLYLISNSRKYLLDMTWKTELYLIGGGDGGENTNTEMLEMENPNPNNYQNEN